MRERERKRKEIRDLSLQGMAARQSKRIIAKGLRRLVTTTRAWARQTSQQQCDHTRLLRDEHAQPRARLHVLDHGTQPTSAREGRQQLLGNSSGGHVIDAVHGNVFGRVDALQVLAGPGGMRLRKRLIGK